ncbi:hypothetical protein J6590_004334 [Homalodisca vitripennis]|nr:hypothetical protein J6590_004334 [Homalodisca vitripennis]
MAVKPRRLLSWLFPRDYLFILRHYLRFPLFRNLITKAAGIGGTMAVTEAGVFTGFTLDSALILCFYGFIKPKAALRGSPSHHKLRSHNPRRISEERNCFTSKYDLRILRGSFCDTAPPASLNALYDRMFTDWPGDYLRHPIYNWHQLGPKSPLCRKRIEYLQGPLRSDLKEHRISQG